MKGDVSGVRISPKEITFLDTQVNTVYTVNITVKNISTVSKGIRYYAPQTKVSMDVDIIGNFILFYVVHLILSYIMRCVASGNINLGAFV